MEESAYWTAVGAIAVAVIGLIGNKWKQTREEKQKQREITQSTSTELERAHENRPWAEMGRRIEDLKSEIDRLEALVAVRDARIDQLRDERDKLRIESTDWQIEARKSAGALARVTELQQQCDEERKQHRKIVERLSAEIRRLRGEH